jgi:hypothetical protein
VHFLSEKNMSGMRAIHPGEILKDEPDELAGLGWFFGPLGPPPSSADKPGDFCED